jgi:hypothetical protein
MMHPGREGPGCGEREPLSKFPGGHGRVSVDENSEPAWENILLYLIIGDVPGRGQGIFTVFEIVAVYGTE